MKKLKVDEKLKLRTVRILIFVDHNGLLCTENEATRATLVSCSATTVQRDETKASFATHTFIFFFRKVK